MSQTYTADPYAGGTVVATTMTAANNNFAALKSAFSGATTPANTVAGQWWYDTTAHILKVRNEANDAWLSVWDLANNKPIIANLSNEITLAMMAASVKSPAAGTEGLRKLGTGALDAAAGDDSRFSAVPDAYVSQAKLKTSSGSISITRTGALPYVQVNNTVLPGGEYGFRQRSYMTIISGYNSCHWLQSVKLCGHGTNSVRYPTAGPDAWTNTSVAQNASLAVYDAGGGYANVTAYGTQRYVTSSGEVFWVFGLRERESGRVFATWISPDHCCFGNSGDPVAFPHPFYDYDPAIHEIIVCNPEIGKVAEIASKVRRGGCLGEALLTHYEVDESRSAPWPTEKVSVGMPEVFDHLMAAEAMLKGEEVLVEKMRIPRPEMVACRSLRAKK